MRASRFTEFQIINILKEARAGLGLEIIVCWHGIGKTSWLSEKPGLAGWTTVP